MDRAETVLSNARRLADELAGKGQPREAEAIRALCRGFAASRTANSALWNDNAELRARLAMQEAV